MICFTRVTLTPVCQHLHTLTIEAIGGYFCSELVQQQQICLKKLLKIIKN